MSCGCKKTTCGCTSSCTTSSACECAEICTALEVANAWNIPACDAEAVLSVPGLETVLIGSYIYNPTYGSFLITGFDSANHQLTVLNPCFDHNEVAGTVVPALTTFIFTAPPSATNITYAAGAVGTNYVLTAVNAAVTFGTSSPEITLTVPGTYLIIGHLTFYSNGVTIATPSVLSGNLVRRNNTPAALTAAIGLAGLPVSTTYTNYISTAGIYPLIYTTANSNDQLGLNASYSGGVPSVGTLEVSNGNITAVKLS